MLKKNVRAFLKIIQGSVQPVKNFNSTYTQRKREKEPEPKKKIALEHQEHRMLKARISEKPIHPPLC
ncbi:hypothetical protein Taro_052634 [Colocasia esculenta]|uniref:Uncharacterized protein n=1 Tax=Colocasia esculenta TaxID=4460 RepID=A0A843XKN6_COLES|nr:hypothetical protein [Colocasia esculenta]